MHAAFRSTDDLVAGDPLRWSRHGSDPSSLSTRRGVRRQPDYYDKSEAEIAVLNSTARPIVAFPRSTSFHRSERLARTRRSLRFVARHSSSLAGTMCCVGRSEWRRRRTGPMLRFARTDANITKRPPSATGVAPGISWQHATKFATHTCNFEAAPRNSARGGGVAIRICFRIHWSLADIRPNLGSRALIAST